MFIQQSDNDITVQLKGALNEDMDFYVADLSTGKIMKIQCNLGMTGTASLSVASKSCRPL